LAILAAWNEPLAAEADALFTNQDHSAYYAARHAEARLEELRKAADALHRRIAIADPEYVGDVKLWAEFSTLGETLDHYRTKEQ